MSGFQVPERTRERQALAADPRRSVWVSANAGSGKTFVLGAPGDPSASCRNGPLAFAVPHLHQGGGGRNGDPCL